MFHIAIRRKKTFRICLHTHKFKWLFCNEKPGLNVNGISEIPIEIIIKFGIAKSINLKAKNCPP